MTFGESMHTMSFADSVESAIPLHLTKGSRMATYRDVKRQIAELEKQAEVLRKAEAVKVIANIKSQIQRFDLKPADLFDDLTTDRSITASPVPVASVAPGVAVKATPAKKSRSVAKYMDPVSKKTWNGHGKAPAWIKNGNRDDFLIATVQAKLNAAPASKKAAAKPAVKTNGKTAPKAQAKPVAKAAAKPAAKTPATKVVAKPAAKSSASKAPVAKKPVAAAPATPAPVAKKPAPAKKPVVKAKAPVKKPAAKPKAAPVKVADSTPPAPVAAEAAAPEPVASVAPVESTQA